MFVLVVTRDAAVGELVRQSLGAEGWWVTAVSDRETAVRSASGQAPQLVVIDGAVDAAADLVRFFAARHGGPGALLLAATDESDPVAAGAVEADAVLPRCPDAETLAVAARRLLSEPQPSPDEELPTPGQVLNAQDIFGDLLLEMESPSPGGPQAATVALPAEEPAESFELPRPAPVAAAETVPIDTRPMIIPEPTPEPMMASDEALDFSFPPIGEPAVAPVSGGAASGVAELAEGEAVASAADDGVGEEESAAPPWADEPEEAEQPEQPEQPEHLEDPEDPEESEESATAMDDESAVSGAVGLDEPEPQPVRDEGHEPGPPVAADAPSVGERLAAMAQRFAASDGTQPEVDPDPLPPSEDAAIAAEEPALAAASSGRRARLPGGLRFWLGMAAGLLVFVLASFLLERFFVPAPEPPPVVTVPAVDGVDLEDLVDREMAQREAELRESLLEEERRLQQQLDELEADGDG